jgi:hypothetical protein
VFWADANHGVLDPKWLTSSGGAATTPAWSLPPNLNWLALSRSSIISVIRSLHFL